MLKVAEVLAGAAQGGAENFFVRLVQGLHKARKADQHAFIRNHAHRVEALRSAGVPTDGFRFGGPLNILDRHYYLKALNGYRPDIVMTWMNRATKLTPRGNYQLVSRLGHYYDLKYYRHCDFWVGISRGICDHLVKGGMPAERVFYIPNFADETAVDPLPRHSFETPADRPLILAAGRLHENKGFDVLLKALKLIPDATLWLAGAGPEEEALRSQCDALALTDRVRFLGWRNDVTALMRTADLFVCPSRHEGLGSIVMESWFHQCPIVATASQGPSELIEDGVTGLVTPVDEVEPLAGAIRQVLSQPAEREAMVMRAAAHYQQYFSEQVIVNQYGECFDHIQSHRR